MARPPLYYRISSFAFAMPAVAMLGLATLLFAGTGKAFAGHDPGLSAWAVPLDHVIEFRILDRDVLDDLFVWIEPRPASDVPTETLTVSASVEPVVTGRADVSDQPMAGAWGHGAGPPLRL